MDLATEFKADKTATYYTRLAETAKNDRNAFAELYDYYFPRVYNYIFAKVKNPDQADDIVSTTFEKMLLRLDSFDSTRGAFSTWLFHIAGNEVRSFYRAASYQHETAWDEFFDPADPERGPEQEVLAAEGNSQLLVALQQLPERDRQIVNLKYFSELSNKEIARIMGLTEVNVGVILHRSLDKLKKFLKKMSYEL